MARRCRFTFSEERLDGDFYTRKISLTPAGSDKIIEWGIVASISDTWPPPFARRFLRNNRHWGGADKHKVLRRIKPRWFLKFPGSGPVLEALRQFTSIRTPLAASEPSTATTSRRLSFWKLC